ncbi:MAG: hypothetical protein Q7R97_04850 [Candidatus Daviesbacteria bacterium]|nr:hypothetical protein [Candidatus Daviesbacteria bacterium]
MLQEKETTGQPTFNDRLKYLEVLVESKRFSTSIGQPYTPITAYTKIIEQVETWLCLDTNVPVSTFLETFEEKTVLQEQQNIIDAEKLQTFNRIKTLRQLIIDKLLQDKKTTKPNPFAYQREIKINDEILQITYYISDPDINKLEISFDKKPLDYRQRNEKIHNFISVDKTGYFRYTMLNIKPNNPTATLYYELNNSISNKNPATAEIILRVDNIMNLYLQTNTDQLRIFKKFTKRVFHTNS